MMSNDALILDLVADLAPVRRRSMWRDMLWLFALAALELALLVMAGAMRPDMARMIVSPAMIWKIASLAILAGVSCAAALRSFAPPAPSGRGIMAAIGVAGLTVIGALFVTPSADGGRSLLERLSPAHGLLCAVSIVVLALPLIAMLAVLMRRAAPVRPARSALAAGLAASTCGALVFTICCPMNDPLYIIAWYSAGIAVVTGAARWLLPRRFRL
jgi:hypothetical protein